MAEELRSSAPRAGALAPFRVLDLTGAAGALCGRLLAGLGADVIKVERPSGDPARAQGPFLGGVPDPGRSLTWLYANAGKRGITLDLTQPDGRALLCRLAAVSDFLIESFPPGYLESIGAGYKRLAAVNPALVMARISPFGQSGPYRDYQATDLVAWAMSGAMSLAGDDDRRPLRVSAAQADLLSGAHAAAGTMTAHYHRQRTGQGQQVDISLQESLLWTLMNAAQTWDIMRVNPPRGGATRRTKRPDGSVLQSRLIWPCKDGFVLWMLGSGRLTGTVAATPAIVAWMAEEGLAAGLDEIDWSAITPAQLDQETYDRLSVPFLAFFATHTKLELFEGAIKRDFQLAPVNEVADVADSPQLAEREYWHDVEHPALETVLRFPGAPVRLSGTPWRKPDAAPLPGQHNADVYGGLLGLSSADLAALSASGVV